MSPPSRHEADVKAYGRLRPVSREDFTRLAGLLPEDAATLDEKDPRGPTLDIEHVGRWFDPQPYLDATAVLAGKVEAHLDYIDLVDWTIRRLELAPGGWEGPERNLDDILEHTKGEGNW